MPRGTGAVNTDPPPQRHRERRKGGPLWLQVPGYVLPVTLCQDQRRVSTTAVLVTTRTGFPRRSDRMLSRLLHRWIDPLTRVTSALPLLDCSPAVAGSIAVAGPCPAGYEDRCR